MTTRETKDINDWTVEEWLEEMEGKEKLNLSRKKIGDKGAKNLAEALKTNKTVKKLDLGRNNIGVVGAQAIAASLLTNTTISFLGLGNNNIGDEGAQAIAASLLTNTTLTVMGLGRNNIGDEGAQAIAASLITNTTLTVMGLGDNNIGIQDQDNDNQKIHHASPVNSPVPQAAPLQPLPPPQATALPSSPPKDHQWTLERFRQLMINEIFELRDMNLGPDGATNLLEAIRTNTTVQLLRLIRVEVGPNGRLDLGQALFHNPTLLKLTIRDMPVDLTTLYESLIINTTLTHLALINNGFSEKELDAIANLLRNNRTIKFLNISQNEIGDMGAVMMAEALRENQTLLEIHLSSNNIGGKGISALAEVATKSTSLKIFRFAETNAGEDEWSGNEDIFPDSKNSPIIVNLQQYIVPYSDILYLTYTTRELVEKTLIVDIDQLSRAVAENLIDFRMGGSTKQAISKKGLILASRDPESHYEEVGLLQIALISDERIPDTLRQQIFYGLLLQRQLRVIKEGNRILAPIHQLESRIIANGRIEFPTHEQEISTQAPDLFFFCQMKHHWNREPIYKIIGLIIKELKISQFNSQFRLKSYSSVMNKLFYRGKRLTDLFAATANTWGELQSLLKEVETNGGKLLEGDAPNGNGCQVFRMVRLLKVTIYESECDAEGNNGEFQFYFPVYYEIVYKTAAIRVPHAQYELDRLEFGLNDDQVNMLLNAGFSFNDTEILTDQPEFRLTTCSVCDQARGVRDIFTRIREELWNQKRVSGFQLRKEILMEKMGAFKQIFDTQSALSNAWCQFVEELKSQLRTAKLHGVLIERVGYEMNKLHLLLIEMFREGLRREVLDLLNEARRETEELFEITV